MELSQRLTLLRRQSGAPRPRKHRPHSSRQTLSKSAYTAYVVRLPEERPAPVATSMLPGFSRGSAWPRD